MHNALIRIVLAACLVAVATTTSASAPSKAIAATGVKVAIIVGPVGSLTDNYRARGDKVAAAAKAAGATVVKAYSPRATWSRVLDAVRGANIIVYFGHGNGFPNPYGTTEWTDRTNGWGLNRTTTHGDRDDWIEDPGLLRAEGAAGPHRCVRWSRPAQVLPGWTDPTRARLRDDLRPGPLRTRLR